MMIGCGKLPPMDYLRCYFVVAGSQREKRNGNNPEAEYQGIVSGAGQLVVVLKSLNGEALTNTFEKK